MKRKIPHFWYVSDFVFSWIRRTSVVDAVAVTLPPIGVFISRKWWRSASIDDRFAVMTHELAHWKQYRRLGSIRFYSKYALLSMKYGYDEHPMEIEAKEAEWRPLEEANA